MADGNKSNDKDAYSRFYLLSYFVKVLFYLLPLDLLRRIHQLHRLLQRSPPAQWTRSADSIVQVAQAFRLLFQDDLLNARALLLEKQPVQPYNHLGLAIVIFIEALLGMEEHVISNALEALFKSEQAIKQAKNSLNSTASSLSNLSANHWWSPGLEFDIMLADVLMFQAILHFMAETVSESMKGIYKLTKAYKIYSASHQTIFSELEKRTNNEPASSSSQDKKISRDDLNGEIGKLIDHIQEFYSEPNKQSLAPTVSSSASYLTSGLNFFGSLKKSTRSSNQTAQVNKPSITYEHWTEDPIASLVIGGSSFGFGLFGLILSFLPPKVMKLLSWVGLNNSNPNDSSNKSNIYNQANQNLTQRNQSIKWLLFSNSSCHWELHAKLAGLGLITYRSVMLKTVGWLADPERAIKDYETLLNSLANDTNNNLTTSEKQQENDEQEEKKGIIWTIHKSRLLLLQGDIKSSKNLIQKKLEQIRNSDHVSQSSTHAPPKPLHSTGLLIYEFALISVRLADWFNAGQAFLSFKEHNAWSHVTYQFAALGCFLLVDNKSIEFQNQIDHLFEELPSLFSKKKSMGRDMPPHEMLVNRKLTEYKAKHADLVKKGSIAPDRTNSYWDSIQISPIEELALLLMIYDDTPKRSLISGIQRLSLLNPTVPVNLSDSHRQENHQDDPLDNQDQIELNLGTLKPIKTDNNLSHQTDLSLSREEMVVRDLLLGVQLMNLGEYDQSRVFLNKIPNPHPSSQQQQLHLEKEEKEKRDRKGEYINYVNALIYKSLIELKEMDSILSESSPSSHSDWQHDQTVTRSKEEEEGRYGIHRQDVGGRRNSNDVVPLCLSKLRVADSMLNSILELPESYHMRSRTESKIQLIKEQIDEKLSKFSSP